MTGHTELGIILTDLAARVHQEKDRIIVEEPETGRRFQVEATVVYGVKTDDPCVVLKVFRKYRDQE